MAVRQRPNGKWLYEFELGAKRHRKIVVAASRRAAEDIETKAKKEAQRALDASNKVTRNAVGGISLELHTCFEKYYQHRVVGGTLNEALLPNPPKRAADVIQLRDGLNMILGFLAGRRIKLLTQVNQDVVSDLRGWRAAQFRWGEERYGRISPSQVNRSVLQPLQRVFTHAREVWQLDLPHAPKWGKLRFKEADRRLRTLSDSEYDAVYTELPEGYRDLFVFSVSSCLRQKESLLLWKNVDTANKECTIIVKGGRREKHPLSARCCELIESLRGNHPTHVFTSVAKLNRIVSGKTHIAGERYPISAVVLQKEFKRACKRAGVEDYHWHDNRRTGASWWCKEMGIHIAQLMLHHRDIQTTILYLGDTNAALRAAIDDVDDKFHAKLERSRSARIQHRAGELLPAAARG